MARKLLFVGRDGALVERAARGAVDSLEDLRLMPGVIPALLRLVAAGYELVVLPDDAGANGAGRARADAYLEALLASQGIGLTASRRCQHGPPGLQARRGRQRSRRAVPCCGRNQPRWCRDPPR
jgi:histidinol phosphatase-like enzyme